MITEKRVKKKKNRSRKNKLIIFLFIVLTFIVYILAINYLNHNDSAHVFSHRGASGEEIEHTFAAYDLAIDYGSKYIEQDIVSSKNGTLFVSHDLSAKRITGHDRYKKDTNYVIELKENDAQINQFLQVVSSYRLSNNIIVQASTASSLSKIKRAFPNIQTLLLVSEQEKLNENLDNLNIDIFGMSINLMNKDNIASIHKQKKLANFWTLNSTDDIKKAIKLNADSYFTNFTAKALLLEKQYRDN